MSIDDHREWHRSIQSEFVSKWQSVSLHSRVEHLSLSLCRQLLVAMSSIRTWTGPAWTPAQCLSSVLLSIQSLMTENPYHNEPGFEKVSSSSLISTICSLNWSRNNIQVMLKRTTRSSHTNVFVSPSVKWWRIHDRHPNNSGDNDKEILPSKTRLFVILERKWSKNSINVQTSISSCVERTSAKMVKWCWSVSKRSFSADPTSTRLLFRIHSGNNEAFINTRPS